MTKIKQNIIANYLGQLLTNLLSLAFIPIYIDYLGIEAYALIALFALIQSFLMLLDLGMIPTINYEMSKFNTGVNTAQFIRELLCSLKIIIYLLAIFIFTGFFIASPYLAHDWLKVDYISADTVENVLVIMAFVVCMRLFEGIYRASLYGLEQQVWYNVVYFLISILRYVGALAVIAWFSYGIEAFFLWQAFISLLTVGVLSFRLHRSLPKAALQVKFSYLALAQVWKFAGGMTGITLLTMILLQVDKVLLSKLLSLSQFGYYALAAAAASLIYIIIVPITQAVFPRIVSYSTNEGQVKLINLYHQVSQLVVVIISPAAMLLCFYAHGVIYMWSGSNELALNTASLLSILALGCFFNSLSYLPYQIQIAHGWISLLFKINLLIVLIIAPLIYITVPHYGSEGAAWIWLIINIAYLLISTHFMHQKLLINEKWRWYFSDLFLPLLGAVVVMYLGKFIQPETYQNRLEWLFFLMFTGALAVLISGFLAKTIRMRVCTYIIARS